MKYANAFKIELTVIKYIGKKNRKESKKDEQRKKTSMNVTNFKVKFNHFVISKAFHSSSGISLVGKRKGDYLCFPVF